MARLPKYGLTVDHLPLPGSFPHPSAADLTTTVHTLARLPTDAVILFDGLAFSALPVEIVRNIRQPIVAIVHHPLSFEPGPSAGRQRELKASEIAALAFAKTVVVSSPTTRTVLSQEFGVSTEHIVIAVPGTIEVPRAHSSGSTPSLLSVGAISPRKGYDILIDALARIAERPWQATIVGTRERDPATAAAIASTISERKLSRRIAMAGQVDDQRLSELYDQADLFVLSSRYEGYGMVLAEALARGLPIVTTTGGAAAETAPDGTALKVPPGDAVALASAIARMLDEPTLRRRIADESWRVGQTLPGWDQTTAIIANVLKAARP
jgi:glycosyltransferase involved in cell wall biosynthesis